MRVAIGSDHAGFELKEAVRTFLAAEHHEVIDVGTHRQAPVDYPNYAQAVGAAVRESRAERGILLCGSGVGASMVANGIPGIRAECERTGALPAALPIFTGDGITLFTDEKSATALRGVLNGEPTLAGYLTAHLSRLGAGDHFALLAHIEMNDAHERALQAMRVAVRDARRVATCVEFGPRVRRSTGQADTGGPNTGVFLQITCDDAVDLAVPGQRYTFGVVKAAQARGDVQVLVERNRRALRVHLGPDVAAGLGTLHRALAIALKDRSRRPMTGDRGGPR
jgi:hypothetical protein